jgi:hypothetical protein
MEPGLIKGTGSRHPRIALAAELSFCDPESP